MMRFINQMLMFPMTVVITSMDVFLKTLRAFQMNVGEGIHVLGETIPALTTDVNGTSSLDKKCACDDRANAQGPLTDTPVQMTNTNASYLITKEESTMGECDLGGDDLKYVSYSILFTKRDFETTLQQEKQEVIDYPTDEGSFGALKIADFMATLKTDGILFPEEWKGKTLDDGYTVDPPGSKDPKRLKSIPNKDRKFIKFECMMKKQLAKQDKDYDRQQVDILRAISSKLGP
jgi:hypothetical protein